MSRRPPMLLTPLRYWSIQHPVKRRWDLTMPAVGAIGLTSVLLFWPSIPSPYATGGFLSSLQNLFAILGGFFVSALTLVATSSTPGFVIPPFSELLVWLRRAHGQWQHGHVETVVCLVPVRTDSHLFHEILAVDADIFLLRGRVRFLDSRGKRQGTPFSLMLLTLGETAGQKDRYADLVPGIWLARRSAPAVIAPMLRRRDVEPVPLGNGNVDPPLIYP